MESNQLYKFKWYFFYFLLFGQNTCIPIVMMSKKTRLILCLPSIVAFIVIFNSEYELTFKRFEAADIFSGMILHTIMLFNMFPSLSAALESFRMPKGTIPLLKTYTTIISYIEKKSLSCFDWNKYNDEIWSKTKLILITYFLMAFYRMSVESPLYGRLYEFSTAMLWFYRSISVIHFVFYIDLLTLQMSTIVFAVRAQAKAIRMTVSLKNLNELIQILKHVKILHFKLWQCSQIFNEYFGWVLVVVLIDSTFTMSVSGYIFFVSFTNHGENLFQPMRKYILYIKLLLEHECYYFLFFLLLFCVQFFYY